MCLGRPRVHLAVWCPPCVFSFSRWRNQSSSAVPVSTSALLGAHIVSPPCSCHPYRAPVRTVNPERPDPCPQNRPLLQPLRPPRAPVSTLHPALPSPCPQTNSLVPPVVSPRASVGTLNPPRRPSVQKGPPRCRYVILLLVH
jgi:hypothetical protein